MLASLPLLWLAVINSIGIPLTHLILAWGSTRLPQSWFYSDLHQASSYRNKSTFFYERICFVRSWKHWLPDAAPWFNGFAKGSLQSKDPDYLRAFIAETKRGELSHWLQIVAISSFGLFNPWPATLIIVVYAFFSNLPCILNLRYTRIRMLRVLVK